MQDEQKQIEKIAKDMCEEYGTDTCAECYGIGECANKFIAEQLYTAGYRKQGDTVREFLKLLKEKESPKLLMWEYGEGYLDCIKTAEELAAEYGVEVEE